MAKNIKNLETKDTNSLVKSTSNNYDYEGNFKGNFEGNLKGNADTATSLKSPMTITLTRDASGSITTNGASKQLSVTVLRADEAEHAKVADSALFVQSAQLASRATFADRATSSDSANNAIHAENAEHAIHADTASESSSSLIAKTAHTATHAVNADNALKADTATTAEHAKVADKLSNVDEPIPKAIHAQRADIAEIALYDCKGRPIEQTYALKSDIPDEYLQLEDIKDLFVPREDEVLQATVAGKAVGRGVKKGNTLEIFISHLSTGNNLQDYNIYDDIVFSNINKDSNTTKVYIDENNYLYFYSLTLKDWVKVNADLDSILKENINNALDKLNNVVDLTSDQNIQGLKYFEGELRSSIADIKVDDPRRVTTVHNLIDLKTEINEEIGNIDTELDTILETVKSLVAGTLTFALVDYSIPQNQVNMLVGTRYLTFLTEDKAYIQIDADTNLPINPDQIPYWYRYYIKSSKGSVAYTDYRINVDLSDYARLNGAIFTGNIEVPDIDISTNDNKVFNSKKVHELIEDKIANANLDKYMPRIGGDFTGKITVPRVNVTESIPNNTQVLNAIDTRRLTETLIKENKSTNTYIISQEPDPDTMEEDSLYLVCPTANITELTVNPSSFNDVEIYTTRDITVTTDATDFTYRTSANDILNVQKKGNVLTVGFRAIGIGILYIEAQKEGAIKSTKAITFNIVNPTETILEATPNIANLKVGESLDINVKFNANDFAHVLKNLNPTDCVTQNQKDANTITLTGVKVGTGNLLLVAKTNNLPEKRVTIPITIGA